MNENHSIIYVSAIAGILIILGWSQIYSGTCSSLAFPFFIIAVVGYCTMELSVKRRECLARSYFVEGSFPYRLFNSKNLILIKSILLSLLLGASLMIAGVSWDAGAFAILALDIFVLLWIYKKVIAIITGNIKENLKYAIAKDIAASANSFLLTIALVAFQFYTPIPSYIDESLKNTLVSAFNTVGSECSITNALLKINVQKDAFGWWAMMNFDSRTHDHNIKLIAWMIFLFNNGLAAYAYSRYMSQLIDFGRIFGAKHE